MHHYIDKDLSDSINLFKVETLKINTLSCEINDSRTRRWEVLKKMRKYIVRDYGEKSYEVMKCLCGKYPMGFHEAGKLVGLQRERVRQIFCKIMNEYNIGL